MLPGFGARRSAPAGEEVNQVTQRDKDDEHQVGDGLGPHAEGGRVRMFDKGFVFGGAGQAADQADQLVGLEKGEKIRRDHRGTAVVHRLREGAIATYYENGFKGTAQLSNLEWIKKVSQRGSNGAASSPLVSR